MTSRADWRQKHIIVILPLCVPTAIIIHLMVCPVVVIVSHGHPDIITVPSEKVARHILLLSGRFTLFTVVWSLLYYRYRFYLVVLSHGKVPSTVRYTTTRSMESLSRLEILYALTKLIRRYAPNLPTYLTTFFLINFASIRRNKIRNPRPRIPRE